MQLFLFRLLAELPIDTNPLPKAGFNSSGNPSSDLLITVFNVIFGILAAISFVTVIYGGFRYVTSRGEPANTAKAKDIILYSIIGLAVSFSAFGIVNLLLKALFP